MTSWKTVTASFVGLAALALAAGAEAHGSTKPQHGGLVQVSGETVVELVKSPSGVAVYIREEDEAVPAADMTADLTVTPAAGATSSVPMVAAGGNRFEAEGLTIPAGSKVGIMLVNKASQARASVTFTVD